jgi:hypothetical protein
VRADKLEELESDLNKKRDSDTLIILCLIRDPEKYQTKIPQTLI